MLRSYMHGSAARATSSIVGMILFVRSAGRRKAKSRQIKVETEKYRGYLLKI